MITHGRLERACADTYLLLWLIHSDGDARWVALNTGFLRCVGGKDEVGFQCGRERGNCFDAKFAIM